MQFDVRAIPEREDQEKLGGAEGVPAGASMPEHRSKGGRVPGYVIQHIVPLRQQGRDTPDNMRWETTESIALKHLGAGETAYCATCERNPDNTIKRNPAARRAFRADSPMPQHGGNNRGVP